MDGKLFLGTARFLLHNGVDEAAYRSAISRAYYACFIVTRDLAYGACMLDSRKKVGGHIGHEPLLRYLKNGLTKEVRQLGNDLAALYGNRKDADYKMKEKIAISDAQDAIKDAEAFFETLDTTSREDIGKAMDSYLNKTNP